MKKITLSTVKSFIRKNSDSLLINIGSRFDGMQDCVSSVNSGFMSATKDSREWNQRNTLGIQGAWFVGSSRDYFTAWETETMQGIEVSNCCGSFTLAISK
jgi:hypothetical protein